jgi:hypothetical protein
MGEEVQMKVSTSVETFPLRVKRALERASTLPTETVRVAFFKAIASSQMDRLPADLHRPEVGLLF